MADSLPIWLDDRCLVAVSGADALDLLQRLTSNDLAPLSAADGIVYTLLLSPQGRYLFDFFVVKAADGLYLDAPEAQAEQLIARLNAYKLRADVTFKIMPDIQVWLEAAGTPEVADPRQAGLGFRNWRQPADVSTTTDYTAYRIAHGIVEPSLDMQSGEDLPLDFGLDKLNAISFSKGCYPGQELTARTHNRDKARYEIARVNLPYQGEGRVIAAAGQQALVQQRRG